MALRRPQPRPPRRRPPNPSRMTTCSSRRKASPPRGRTRSSSRRVPPPTDVLRPSHSLARPQPPRPCLSATRWSPCLCSRHLALERPAHALRGDCCRSSPLPLNPPCLALRFFTPTHNDTHIHTRAPPAQIIEAKGLYAIQRFSFQQLRMNIVSQDRVPTPFVRVKARHPHNTHTRTHTTRALSAVRTPSPRAQRRGPVRVHRSAVFP